MESLAVMRRILLVILDAVLPRKARTVRVETLTPENIPLTPEIHDLLGQKITALMDYEDTRVADLIQSLKYDGSARAASICASALSEYLTEEISSQKLFSDKKISIVPVPLHSSRMRERGFNQMESVLKVLSSELLAAVCTDLIERTRATAQQTRRTRSERLSNLAGAFSLAGTYDLKKHHIYLIDDVTTTGATLVNAATPLRRAGATVSMIALARA